MKSKKENPFPTFLERATLHFDAEKAQEEQAQRERDSIAAAQAKRVLTDFLKAKLVSFQLEVPVDEPVIVIEGLRFEARLKENHEPELYVVEETEAGEISQAVPSLFYVGYWVREGRDKAYRELLNSNKQAATKPRTWTPEERFAHAMMGLMRSYGFHQHRPKAAKRGANGATQMREDEPEHDEVPDYGAPDPSYFQEVVE